jgi:hypothetical protein
MENKQKKDTEVSWSELAYKLDPSLRDPKPTYVFNDGKRIFYDKDKNARNRKS